MEAIKSMNVCVGYSITVLQHIWRMESGFRDQHFLLLEAKS